MKRVEAEATPSELTVFIHTPYGQDAKFACSVLENVHVRCKRVPSFDELQSMMKTSMGALLISEEALTHENTAELRQVLSKQEKWSDLPILLLTSKKERSFNTEKILTALSYPGNIALLERPFRMMTLITAAQVALRARKRQYQVRNLIHSQQVALKQRDDFLSIASHELKTPITSLQLQVQMMKRLLHREDPIAYSPLKTGAFINTVEKQVLRLSRLVEDMLDTSRIENGKLTLNFEKIEIGALVQDVVDAFSGQFEASGCTFSWSRKEIAYAFGDRYRMEQVVTNLISNAIKYGNGKPITGSVYGDERGSHISIQDQGFGIAPENLERIFEQFERAISADNISGLGLGLYISRQIILMHSGQVFVESIGGKGSSFLIELPSFSPAQTENHGDA